MSQPSIWHKHTSPDEGPVLEALLVNEERLSFFRRQHGCFSIHDLVYLYISDTPQSLNWSICLTYQAANEQDFPLREDRNCLRNHLYIFCKNWSGNNLRGSYNCSLSERRKLIIGQKRTSTLCFVVVIINLLSHSDSQDWIWVTSGFKSDFSVEL